MEFKLAYREPLYRNSKPIECRVTKGSCWEVYSHVPNRKGYPKLTIRGKTYLLSRLVYCQENNLDIEEFSSEVVVRHRCDNSLCINPEHLQIGSTMDNVRDKVERGRQPTGITHGRTHLTREDVVSIFYDKRRQIDIAAEYQISQSRVSGIKRKETFKDVLEDL